MANCVIWIALLFTASYVSGAVLPSTIIADDGVHCNDNDVRVTLQLADVDATDRPQLVLINGYVTDSCKQDVAGDTAEVTATFGECGVERPNGVVQFKLYLVQQPTFLSEDDNIVQITCNEVNVGKVSETIPGFSETPEVEKNGEKEILADPTEITMTFVKSDGATETTLTSTSTVNLGDTITLKLSATDPVSFDVIGCSVETTDKTGGNISPVNIITEWCAIEHMPVENFINKKGAGTGGVTSTSTFKAFRMNGQGPSSPLKFTCNLRWCSTDNGLCKHPLAGCSTSTTRRRRRQIIDQDTKEKTVTSSLRVNLPGIVTSGTTAMVGNAKLAVLLFCGLRYIMY